MTVVRRPNASYVKWLPLSDDPVKGALWYGMLAALGVVGRDGLHALRVLGRNRPAEAVHGGRGGGGRPGHRHRGAVGGIAGRRRGAGGGGDRRQASGVIVPETRGAAPAGFARHRPVVVDRPGDRVARRRNARRHAPLVAGRRPVAVRIGHARQIAKTVAGKRRRPSQRRLRREEPGPVVVVEAPVRTPRWRP